MRKRRVLPIVSFVIGLCLLAVGAKMVIPDVLSLSDYRNLADEVLQSSDEADDGGDDDVDGAADNGGSSDSSDGGESDEDAPYSVDWTTLNDEFGDTLVAWVSVDNTTVNYPVIQGDDNLYYLYHDIWGRSSYANIFCDYRADPNGQNVICYGHTHYSNSGFRGLAEADEQWSFDTIGKVWYSTPEKGTLGFTPVCALHVYPQYQTVQRFEWEGTESDAETYLFGLLSQHAAKGEWNEATLAGQGVTFDASRAVRSTGPRSDVDYWWVATDAEVAEAQRYADDLAYKAWLFELLDDSTASRADAEELIRNADRSVVLACCSWPFDSHRTLLVCVR